MSRSPKRQYLQIEQFQSADALGITLPQLVLGISIDYRELTGDSRCDYRFKSGRQWHKLAYQTCGVAAKQRYLIGTLLRPSERAAKGIPELTQTWRATSVGAEQVTLTQLGAYRDTLRHCLGVDCNLSYGSFAEGSYPADLCHIGALAADQLPNPLDDLMEWDTGFDRMAFGNRWTLAVIAPNVSE